MRVSKPQTLTAIEANTLYTLIISLSGFRSDIEPLTIEEKKKIVNYAKSLLQEENPI